MLPPSHPPPSHAENLARLASRLRQPPAHNFRRAKINLCSNSHSFFQLSPFSNLRLHHPPHLPQWQSTCPSRGGVIRFLSRGAANGVQQSNRRVLLVAGATALFAAS